MTEDSDTPSFGPAPNEGHGFRALVGLLSVMGALAGFAALFVVEIPARNENALLLALGMVFGWGSAVIQSEYGASATGRKVANKAIDGMKP